MKYKNTKTFLIKMINKIYKTKILKLTLTKMKIKIENKMKTRN